MDPETGHRLPVDEGRRKKSRLARAARELGCPAMPQKAIFGSSWPKRGYRNQLFIIYNEHYSIRHRIPMKRRGKSDE
jgi:hypothetical protein